MNKRREGPNGSPEEDAPRDVPPNRSPDEDAPRDVRQRSELEIRWRQARNAPPPVVRAVLANLAVAIVGGIILLLFDWLASDGIVPGTALLSVAPIVYVAIVIVSGSVLTYLWVELPSGAQGERRRSGWSAILGLFASIPIVYMSLVVIFQLLRPLLP